MLACEWRVWWNSWRIVWTVVYTFVKTLIIHARLRAACMIKLLKDCTQCGSHICQYIDHTCSLASGVYDQTSYGLYELWFIHSSRPWSYMLACERRVWSNFWRTVWAVVFSFVKTLIAHARLQAACMIKLLKDCMNCGLYVCQDLDHTCSLASGVYDQTPARLV